MDRMSEQEQAMEKLRFDSQTVISRTAEIIAGQPVEGLEEAAEYLAKSPGIGPRGETDFPQLEGLSDEQVTQIRTEVAKIGIGASESVGLKEAGLPEGTTVIAEGGLPNKMLAQLRMITQNERKPDLIVMSASQTREAGDSDATRMQQISDVKGIEAPDVTGKTEFDLAPITAEFLDDFEPSEPEVLPFGYDIFDGGITPNNDETGQVVRIGSIGDTPVVVVGISELHRDDSGKNFFRPSVAHLKELSSRIAESEVQSSPETAVATITSNLYGPSRRLQNPDTLTYGTKVMEDVAGAESAPASIPNIVSELHRTNEILIEQAN